MLRMMIGRMLMMMGDGIFLACVLVELVLFYNCVTLRERACGVAGEC